MELAKVKITFAVTLTTMTGYVLASEQFDTGMLLPALGIFLLACGSSAINHFQERDKDALMERTKDRPIPSGRISPNGALLFALVLSIAGSWVLYSSAGMVAMQLGLLALIWYNGIYTPLKRKTAFAVFPGSVIGAIPPLVGWVAGGGSLLDFRALILAFFFFIWQVPHFWLLMLKYGEQYKAAGYPSITSVYTTGQIKNITFIWIIATAVSALMLPFFDVVNSFFVIVGMIIASIWLMIVFGKMALIRDSIKPFFYFMRINYFVLTIIILLTIDHLFVV
jgi:protoheme IX farnesyltransferase